MPQRDWLQKVFLVLKNNSKKLHGTNIEGSFEESCKMCIFCGCGKILLGGQLCLGIIELYGCL